MNLLSKDTLRLLFLCGAIICLHVYKDRTAPPPAVSGSETYVKAR